MIIVPAAKIGKKSHDFDMPDVGYVLGDSKI